MKKSHFLFLLISLGFLLAASSSRANKEHPDTVKVGVYVTSIHDIDFKQKEFTINFWLWLTYKNKSFDFYQNIEVPQAKTVNKSFMTVDSSDGKIFMQMKLQCVMKDSWKIGSFPFDKQKLRLSIENSQFDSRDFVFVPDTVGKHYDPRFTLSGWTIDSCIISTGIKEYETAFGDETALTPHSEYSSFKVMMNIRRDASGLFWKMFLGMYIAFLIAYTCFYIHPNSIDSRFGISVGSLFAVIGNKYIVDSALPESTSFTLVDSLHGLTLFFIFCVITSTAFTLHLVTKGKEKQAQRFDMIAAQVLLVIYLSVNAYLITNALST